MTICEFDTMEFNAGTQVMYKGKIKNVGSVDFEERLLGIYPPETEDLDDPEFRFDWIRCENCTIINQVN